MMICGLCILGVLFVLGCLWIAKWLPEPGLSMIAIPLKYIRMFEDWGLRAAYLGIVLALAWTAWQCGREVVMQFRGNGPCW